MAELKAATKNFRPEALLGEGGFGKVYKGWLEEKGYGKRGNPMVIAVKKLKSDSMQGIEEWQVLYCYREENSLLFSEIFLNKRPRKISVQKLFSLRHSSSS